MAFTRVNPGDPIHASQIDQIIDALDGASGAGQPIALTALNDATNYALTVQNDEATNSRALNVLKSDGTTLIKADVTGVTLGSPLNLPTGSVTSAAIANAGIANVDLGPDVARANLLTNGGFEVNQRVFSATPTSGAYTLDRWQALVVGTGVSGGWSQLPTPVDAGSQYSLGAAVTTSTIPAANAGVTNAVAVQQKLEAWPQLKGQTITFSIRISSATAGTVQPYVNDGVAQYSAAGVATTTSFQTFSITVTVSASATTLLVGVCFGGGTTYYLDNANVVLGSQQANYVPLHPADDLARAQRYYKRFAATSSITLGAAHAYGTGNFLVDILMSPQLAVVPTVTVSAPGDWQVYNASASPAGACSSLSGNVLHAQSCQLIGAVASGLVAGNSTWLQNVSGNSGLAFEANP